VLILASPAAPSMCCLKSPANCLQIVGRSPYLQAVHVMAPASLIGSVKRVTVTEVGSNSLFGTLADEMNAAAFATAGA
ncbi:MAG: hypothetical protein WB475_12735, partial [Pseudolabrys sp.]